MSISIPVEELYLLMGVNGIGFIPDSPFTTIFEKFSRKPRDLNIKKLGVSLYTNGFITSTETLQPTKDIRNKIEICAAPDGFYSVLSRFYNKIFYTEFYEKDGEVVEFSAKENICYFKDTGTRKRLTESIQSVLNGTDTPQIPSMRFPVDEYILLGAAFYFQEISDLTGPLEETGKPIHFTITDLKEEISSNPKFDIVDALSEIGSGYEHSKLIKDDTVLRSKVEKLIAKGYLTWIDPSTGTLGVGPAAQRFYELMMRPSALFISIAGSDMSTYDVKNRLSFFWSDKNLFKVIFEDVSIIFTGIEKSEVPEILVNRILVPTGKKEKEKTTKTETTPQTKNFCPKCGWKNERGALFCPKCGKTLRSDS